MPFQHTGYQASSTVQSLYFDFIVLNKKFSDFFQFGHINSLEDIFNSKEGIVIMQFIAFSYTYHYLNWFTKTSVIKWHEVSVFRAIAISGTYITLLLVFFWDKKLGISLLTLLSLAHLILEFPLNWISVKQIFKGD
ncbi:MAG: hypothetical protein NW207_01010 [Cytophagales bacterium]|nr:hypothetical protein [Cytophagales bacterium]